MRLIVAGTPEVALPSLDALAVRHDIVAVLTRPPAAQGRHARLVPSPVASWAQARGVEILDPVSPRDPALLERLVALAPDCCPVIAYGGLIPPALLAVPVHGWVNLHFSLLPRWRGAAPVQHALLAGDSVTGVTVFRLVKELDAGPVYVRREVPIEADEVAGDLLDRLSIVGAEALCETLDAIESGRTPVEQLGDGVTLAPKIEVED
ncbi:MAG: methionyl-tRNA formyltransferase, partial [Propionibacteriaceae bacterium]|nr:methionyl-tRNA formyltransferase [Propionibacteriaceae bacterium]